MKGSRRNKRNGLSDLALEIELHPKEFPNLVGNVNLKGIKELLSDLSTSFPPDQKIKFHGFILDSIGKKAKKKPAPKGRPKIQLLSPRRSHF